MMIFRSMLPNSLFADEESQFTNFTIKLEDKLETLELENVKLKKEMKDVNDKLMREVEEVKKNSITKTNFIDELIRNLEATAKEQSPSSVKISVLRKFLYGHKKNKSNEEELDRDCYVLMMFSPMFSVSWLLGFFTFTVQVTLGSLLINDQVNSASFGITTLDVPIKGKWTMQLAQFLTIILAIASQTDVLNGLRTILLLRYDKEQWPKVLKKENDLSLKVWLKHVFFPNMLKILEGVIILAATFLVILQSRRVVELLKDFTSLFVISAVDDLFFEIAGIGYFGSKLRKKTNELKDVKIGENNNKFSVYHYLLPALTTLCMLGSWVSVMVRQHHGQYVRQMHPLCPVDDTLINGQLYLSIIGDGICQFQKGMGTNILNCGWDGGDCLILNERYPDCELEDPSQLGDGACNKGKYNTLLCGFDNGDCKNENTAIEKIYPNCNVENYFSIIRDGLCQFQKGMGTNILNCGWDGGDCLIFNDIYPDCEIEDPSLLGNGECDTGRYNTLLCGFDNGDCENENTAIETIYPNCNVEILTFVGDGICNAGEYYSEDCGLDGGDCMNCNVGNMSLIGDGNCNGGEYNTTECNFDGGDCTECHVDAPSWIGDGFCDGGDYNTIECGWDGMDCVLLNSYPDCKVEIPFRFGDGVCDGYYNTTECGWDGGDCLVEGYPDCHVDEPRLIGNGECNGGDYNTNECGWDGGDCLLEQIGVSRFYYIPSFATHYEGCKAEGSKHGLVLASIHSKAENDMIINEVANLGHFFLGGVKTGPRSFEWEDGSEWDYENWAQGQPDSYMNRNENSVGIWYKYEWHDIPSFVFINCLFADPSR